MIWIRRLIARFCYLRRYNHRSFNFPRERKTVLRQTGSTFTTSKSFKGFLCIHCAVYFRLLNARDLFDSPDFYLKFWFYFSTIHCEVRLKRVCCLGLVPWLKFLNTILIVQPEDCLLEAELWRLGIQGTDRIQLISLFVKKWR